MIRILIADDHAIIRHGLKQIIEESGECALVNFTLIEAFRAKTSTVFSPWRSNSTSSSRFGLENTLPTDFRFKRRYA